MEYPNRLEVWLIGFSQGLWVKVIIQEDLKILPWYDCKGTTSPQWFLRPSVIKLSQDWTCVSQLIDMCGNQ